MAKLKDSEIVINSLKVDIMKQFYFQEAIIISYSIFVGVIKRSLWVL